MALPLVAERREPSGTLTKKHREEPGGLRRSASRNGHIHGKARTMGRFRPVFPRRFVRPDRRGGLKADPIESRAAAPRGNRYPKNFYESWVWPTIREILQVDPSRHPKPSRSFHWSPERYMFSPLVMQPLPSLGEVDRRRRTGEGWRIARHPLRPSATFSPAGRRNGWRAKHVPRVP